MLNYWCFGQISLDVWIIPVGNTHTPNGKKCPGSWSTFFLLVYLSGTKKGGRLWYLWLFLYIRKSGSSRVLCVHHLQAWALGYQGVSPPSLHDQHHQVVHPLCLAPHLPGYSLLHCVYPGQCKISKDVEKKYKLRKLWGLLGPFQVKKLKRFNLSIFGKADLHR